MALYYSKADSTSPNLSASLPSDEKSLSLSSKVAHSPSNASCGSIGALGRMPVRLQS